jgi:hypothetical protein
LQSGGERAQRPDLGADEERLQRHPGELVDRGEQGRPLRRHLGDPADGDAVLLDLSEAGARLDQRHLAAGAGQVCRQGAADRPRADDADALAGCHVNSRVSERYLRP